MKCLIHTFYVEYGFGLFPLKQYISQLQALNHVPPVFVLAHELIVTDTSCMR